MSLRPVRGRSSAVVLVCMSSFLIHFGSTSAVTIAWPSLSDTCLMRPICTPATRTLWPCPGMTAWASENAILSWNGFGSMNGSRGRDAWFSTM